MALDGLTIEESEPNEEKKRAIIEAYLSGDTDYLTEMALEQEDDGAEVVSLYLDLLKGTPVTAENIALAVQAISSISSLPIFLKSDDEERILTALRVFEGRAIAKTSDELAKKVAVFGAVKI